MKTKLFSNTIHYIVVTLCVNLTSFSFASNETEIKRILPHFPKSFETTWDRDLKKGEIKQPTWWKKLRPCDEVWIKHQKNEVKTKKHYRFTDARFPKENYTRSKAKQHGCKGSEEETQHCLLKKRYQDYVAHYEKALSNDGKEYSRKRRDCYKKWTVLIAMDAANNLFPYSLWDLFEIEAGFKSNRAGSTSQRDIIAQHDGPDRDGIYRLHLFELEKSLKETYGKIAKDELNLKLLERFRSETILDRKSPVIDVLDESIQTTKKQRFIDFLKWGIREYPAEHYVVVFWGHGKGWLLEDPKKVAHLSGFELTEALKEVVLDPNGLQGQRPIDNFVADACFMQGVELATELSLYTRFFSASSQVQTFMGLPYSQVLYDMNSSFKRLTDRYRKDSQRLKRFAADLEKRGQKPEAHAMHERANSLIREIKSIKADPPLALAHQLPYLMKSTLKNTGYTGRVDLSNKDAPNAVDFFTYASVDGVALRQKLLPELEKLAFLLKAFLDESPEEREDRKFLLTIKIPDLDMFGTDLRTRELGTAVRLMRRMQLSFPDSRAAKAVSDQAGRVDKVLNQVIPAFEYADTYKRNHGFRALAVWLARNRNEYTEGLPDFLKTHFYQFNSGLSKAGTSAWQEALAALHAPES